MKILTLLAVLFLSPSEQSARNIPTLSPDAEISIVTLGPWQYELYSAFGHSAIRLSDPQLNFDAFFNYGAFSFDQPNFYLNFARGHLNYKLDVDPYRPVINYYISNNRFVHEQILDLTQEQKQKVYEYLYHNAQPENQYYMYDYFYNNCATKLRDVLRETLKEEVNFDSTYIATTFTIRQLTDMYLVHQPWGDLGIDICLGLPMDKVASPYEYMFLPDYIESSFDHATVRHDSIVKPLVKKKLSIYESGPEEIPKALIHPMTAFTLFLLLTLAITWFNWKRATKSKWFDVIVFGVTGLVGLLLFLLWVATDHRAAAKNFNLLWAMPLHVVFLPLYLLKKDVAIAYFKAITVLTALLLATWSMLPQQLNLFFVPFVMALAIRAYFIGFLSPKLTTTKA